MRIAFDPLRNARNIAERGLAFERVADLEWKTAIAVEDARHDDGGTRPRVFGLLHRRLHVAVITIRGDATHVISLTKANRNQVGWYGQETG